MSRPRSPLKSLAAILDGGEALVALFDDDRRLVYANQRVGEWLGVETETLLGRVALFTSEPQSDPLDYALARIAPPPEAFAGLAGRTTLASASPRYAKFLPLAIAGGHAVLMIAT